MFVALQVSLPTLRHLITLKLRYCYQLLFARYFTHCGIYSLDYSVTTSSMCQRQILFNCCLITKYFIIEVCCQTEVTRYINETTENRQSHGNYSRIRFNQMS